MCRVIDCTIALCLIAAGYRDFRTRRLSVLFLVGLSALVVLARAFFVKVSVSSAVFGVLIGAFFWVLSACTRQAIGYGDSWLITLLGFYLGGRSVIELILVASILSCLFAVGLCMLRGWNKKHTLPFVPFLAIGYMVVIFL